MTNAERQRERRAKRTPEEKAAAAEYYRRWRERNPPATRKKPTKEKKREYRLKRYGLTPEEHARMVESQNGLCAICDTPAEKLCVDHCHQTGKVRGLLCDKCNTAIGLLADSTSRTRRALDYLMLHAETGSHGTD